MTTTTVATTPRAPGARNIYYTCSDGGREPTRTWVRTLPEPCGLTGLAAFLAGNVPNTSNHRGALAVRIYDDRRTEADVARAAIRRVGGRWEYGGGAGWFSGPDAEQKCRQLVENFIRVYDMVSKIAHITDWKFPLAGIDESPESFWNRSATEILNAGATRVVVDAPLAPRIEYRCAAQ